MSPSGWDPHWSATLSRRAFLGGMAAAATVVVLPVGAQLVGTLFAGPVAAPKRSMYVPHLHTTFGMTDGSGAAASVRLAGIDDLRPARVAGDDNRFSLTFHGPASQRLPQGIYTFSHPGMETVDLFVVPVDRGVSGRHYEAIINRRS